MIILYNPPSNAQRKPILPMSLLALGAVLEGEHEYKIVDGNLVDDPVATLDHIIRETGADILAVTVMPGPQLNAAVPTCRQIKAMHPALRIIWGGYFPTQHYEVCLKANYVDFVVRSHGEIVFKHLIDILAKGGDLTALPGLAYRDPIKHDIRSNPLAPIPDPDRLPDFPYDRIDLPRYIRRTFMGNRTLPHHSSYGCPFYCNFCAVVNMVNGRWLPQSAERTARVVRSLVNRWQIDSVDFYDNNFFTHEA